MVNFSPVCDSSYTRYCDECGGGGDETSIHRINPSKDILMWLCTPCLQKAFESSMIQLDRAHQEIENRQDQIWTLDQQIQSLEDRIWELKNA